MPGPLASPVVDLPDALRPGPLLTLLVSPDATGSDAALADLAERARRAGRAVVEVSPDPAEQQHAWLLLARLAGAAAGLWPGSGSTMGRGPLASVGTRESLIATVCRLLRGLPDPLVLVNDGQWADPATAGALPALLRGLSGSGVRCVATVRGPVGFPGARVEVIGSLTRLRREGLLVVRALGRSESGDQDADADIEAVVATLRAAPQPVWPVAVAMAALHPVGAGAAALAADALGLTPSTVMETLQVLVRMGVVRGGATRGWRFVSRAVAATLRAAVGPYQSRKLARLVVQAVWRETVDGCPSTYLGEQLVRAGTSVDGERSARTLMTLAGSLPMTDGRAVDWLAAASDLTRDPLRRVQARLGLAAAAANTGDHALALRSARLALDEVDSGQPGLGGADGRRDGLRLHARLLLLRAAHALRDSVALARAAQEPGTIEQAAALSMMDCWPAAAWRLAALGVASSPDASSGPATTVRAELRERTSAVVGPWCPAAPDASADPGDPLRRDRAVQRVGTLLAVGDLAGAHHLMHRCRLDLNDLTWPERALLAWRRGTWAEALDHAATAGGLRSAAPPVDAVLARAVALMTLAHGRPVHALEQLANQDSLIGLPHLRDLTRAEIEAALGDNDRAGAALTRAAAIAVRDGVTLGTDEIWLRLAELARSRGSYAQSRQYATLAVRAARSIGTPLSALHAQLAQIAAGAGTADTARQALVLARELDQPWVKACVLERVATWGAGPAELLTQAYELFGQLDAILDRARLRTAMRSLGVTVPNRSATAAENERLLAELVAEGLSGQRLSAAVRATPKSVESRLGRLFARTGHRSRAALAAAVATPDLTVHATSKSSSASSGTGRARHVPRSATNARLTLT